MCTIGRAKENDVVLNDRRVSRKHAFIVAEGDAFKIIDGYVEEGQLLRSVNHVFVNGTMQLEALLGDGDMIMIGESRLEYREVAKPTQPIIAPPPTTNLTIDNISVEKPAEVKFDDSPMGHTQVQISVN